MADFQDLHFGVAVTPGGVHGVEDGLKLGFDVQDGIAGLAFIGSADGDQDAEGTRKRAGGSRPGSEVAAQQAHAGLQRGEPAVGQAGGLEGDGEEVALRGLEREEDVLVARAGFVEQGGEGVRDGRGEDDPPHGLSQARQLGFPHLHGSFDGAPLSGGEAGVEELLIGEGEVRSQAGLLLGGYGLAVELRVDGDPPGSGPAEGDSKGPPAGARTGRCQRGLVRVALDGRDQLLDPFEAEAGAGAEQGRDGRVGVDHHGDDPFAVLDHLIDERAHLGGDPAGFEGGLGKEEEAYVVGGEPFIDPGDDVAPRADLPESPGG
jgi:hypothetical protein